jgi:hypothetical protein
METNRNISLTSLSAANDLASAIWQREVVTFNLGDLTGHLRGSDAVSIRVHDADGREHGASVDIFIDRYTDEPTVKVSHSSSSSRPNDDDNAVTIRLLTVAMDAAEQIAKWFVTEGAAS